MSLPPNPTARCVKCLHVWHPYENSHITLPLEVILPCPKCTHVNQFVWLDEETQKEHIRKKYILGTDDEFKSVKQENTTLQERLENETKKNVELQTQLNEEIENNKILVKIIDRLTTVLEKLGIKVDEGGNPLAK